MWSQGLQNPRFCVHWEAVCLCKLDVMFISLIITGRIIRNPEETECPALLEHNQAWWQRAFWLPWMEEIERRPFVVAWKFVVWHLMFFYLVLPVKSMCVFRCLLVFWSKAGHVLTPCPNNRRKSWELVHFKAQSICSDYVLLTFPQPLGQ